MGVYATVRIPINIVCYAVVYNARIKGSTSAVTVDECRIARLQRDFNDLSALTPCTDLVAQKQQLKYR